MLGYIAPACYAREARLHRPHRLSTLVAVDVVRRNPLTKKKTIDSPLTVFTGGIDTSSTVEGSEPITSATVTPLPVRTEPANTGVRTKKPAGKAAVDESRPAVIVGGEDVSDYID